MKGRVSLKNNYGAIIFIVAGILIVPQLYYLSNIDEFSYDVLLISAPLALSLILFLLSVIFPLGQRVQLLLAGAGLSILLCDQFLRLDISHLDGASRVISIDPFFASINALLYFGLPLIFLVFGGKFKKLLIDLSFVLIFLGAGITFYSIFSSFILSPDDGHKATKQVGEKIAVKSDKNLPNIYFIWLDAMETGYMKKYISNTRILDTFAGFTLFENNSANYLYTLQSHSSFMSGTIFKDGSYEEWSKQSDNLRQDLDNIGYRITTYAKKPFLSSLDDAAYSSDDTYLKWAYSQHPFVADFIAYWLVRSLPGFYANQSLENGKILGGLIHSWFNPNTKYSNVKTISDGIEPLSGVFTLKQLIADEKYRGDKNEFVIAQALIPHGPYVIDRKCNYRGRSPEAPYNAYYEQVECSSSLVAEFFTKLKSLNRYDSSLIIVMGDHGSGWAGPIEGFSDGKTPLNNKYMPWSKSMVISRASALLMIKPPKTQLDMELSISDKESQLVDIYPTILSSIEHSEKIPTDIDGIDLFSDKKPDREKSITYFKPGRIIDPYDAEIYDLTYASFGGLKDIQYRSRFKSESDLPSIECNQRLQFASNSDAEHYRSPNS